VFEHRRWRQSHGERSLRDSLVDVLVPRHGTVKYLTFVMRADHNGEGGIFALLAIVPERFRTAAARTGKVTGMALLAVIGAALLYGDGASATRK
jgi:K+ transporter